MILPLAFRKPPSWSTLQGAIHPIKGWLIFTTLIAFFSWVWCPMVFIMLVLTLLWSFKMISYVLVGLWRLWIFDYPISLHLYFHTPNLVHWCERKGVPSISVSITYVQYFSLIWGGNPKLLAFQCGLWMWSLMEVEVQGTMLNYIPPNEYLGFLWPTLHPMHV